MIYYAMNLYVLNSKVHVLIGKTKEAKNKLKAMVLDNYDLSEEYEGAVFYIKPTSKYHEFLVHLPEPSLPVMAHESTHIALMIMETLGESITGESEVPAYIVEYLIEQYIKKTNKRTG